MVNHLFSRIDMLSHAVGNDDRTETYFFAETLKYLWLLFSDRDSDRIKKFVFNTEAHPFQIRGVEQDKGSGFELFS